MKVRIENFQSIRDVEFEIDGFTVITGPSNIGKSAIYRAIHYPLHAMVGNGFVRQGAKFARVTIEDEDLKIVWEKGPNVNKYYINDDSKPEDKVNREVPQKIIDAGYSDISIRGGKTKLSPQFASQHGGNVFLLDETPGTIAEVLAQLSRLEVLMKASKATDADLRSTKSTLKIREEDKKRLEEKVSRFEGIEDLNAVFTRLKEKKKDLSEWQGKLNRVRELSTKLDRVSKVERSLEGLESVHLPDILDRSVVEDLQRVDLLKSRYMRSKSVVEKLLGLESLTDLPEVDLGSWQEVSRAYTRLAPLIKLSGLPIPEVPDLPEVDLFPTVSRLAERYKDQVKSFESVQQELETLGVDLESAHKALHKLQEEIGQCPLCERAFA